MNNPVIRTVAALPEALAVLGSAGERPVILVSPPHAATWLGASWWLALRDLARDRSGRDFDDLLDCDDASGWALEALRLGLRGLILSPTAPGRATVAARCAMLGATLLDQRPAAADD